MADKTDTTTVTPPISCFWGTPYQDASGTWKCPDNPANPNPTATPVPPLGTRGGGRGGSTINIILPSMPANNYPAVNLPVADQSQGQTTIFGISPLMALGVGAVVLWALSSLGGDSDHKGRH